jgi:hypothetical protein
MRLRRLVFEWEGRDAASLELHPCLTVVAGMERPAQEALASELVGALCGDRPGVRVELDGLDPSEVPAALVRAGLHGDAGSRIVRFDATRAAEAGRGDPAIEALASADQQALWATAEALRSAEAELGITPGGDEDDDEPARLLEARHAAYEAAGDRFESVRSATFYSSGFFALIAIPTMVLHGEAGLAAAGLAGVGAVVSLLAWLQVLRTRRAEKAALEAVGAASYIRYSLRRANGLLEDGELERLQAAAAARQTALAEWRAIAGDVPVGWAVEQREEIEAAAFVHRQIESLVAVSYEEAHVEDITSEDLVHALVTHLSTARHRGDGVPVVLVEPFAEVDRAILPVVLELLCRAAADQQLVVLTGDEAIASWARLEAMTGDVALVEPTGASVVHQ